MLFQRATLCFILFSLAFATSALAQNPVLLAASTADTPSGSIALEVSKNTPLQIALEKEVRVRKAGQLIQARLVQPLYAFDRLVVPVGTRINGRVAAIEGVSKTRRMMGVMNGDLTPAGKVRVEFSEIVLADGRRIPFHAIVTPGSGQEIRLASSNEKPGKKTVKDSTAEKIGQAKQEARRQWQDAVKQVREPGKMRRLERYAVSQLPVHPQYIPAGTLYFAELQEPLDFGSEPATPQLLASIGSTLPQGSLVHALLLTPLDSATTRKSAEVEAVITQPLFDGDRLILPQGSRLKGTVLEAQPARFLHHNGKLRIAFHEIVPPDGIAQKVVASLEGVQAAKDEHVKLDSEGGAEASSPKTRYASTAISLALTSVAFHQHNDGDANDAGQSQHGVLGGAIGFRLVGIALGAAIKSQPFGMAMAAYGSGRSVYSHFIARGRDVVFPKNTAMEIGIGSRGKTVLSSTEEKKTPEEKKTSEPPAKQP